MVTVVDYTQIPPNVLIVTANQDAYDSQNHIEEPVKVVRYCWLGVESKIMPGVELVMGQLLVQILFRKGIM
jgi:acetyltransferase-like isoleucine patch superfamily enzyme